MLTTGTGSPMNGANGCMPLRLVGCDGHRRRGRRASAARSARRRPRRCGSRSSPCSPGVRPVVIDVSAVAVVVGATVVIGPPAIAARVGARCRRACSCSHPSPSTTNSTTCARRAATAGIQSGLARAGGPEERGDEAPHVGAAVAGGSRVMAPRCTTVHHLRGAIRQPARPAHAGRHAAPFARTMWRMRVSSKGDYACRALLSLTLHAGDPGPTSVRDIAERTAIPQPYLEQILLALKGAGLVRSKRGVGGGYVLARPPDEIRLSEMLAAVDGPISLGDFGEPAPGRLVRSRGPVRAVRHLEARPASTCASCSTGSPSRRWPGGRRARHRGPIGRRCRASGRRRS